MIIRPVTDHYSFEEMLDAFRGLGGIAENITQRRGQLGNGIFVVDPSKPAKLLVPERLLVDDTALVLEDGNLVVDPKYDVAQEVREFYQKYQQHFSWGADGKRGCEDFEKQLKQLPQDVLKRLKSFYLLDLEKRHAGDWDEVVRRGFLHSRRIRYKKRTVIMPVIELVNHHHKALGYRVGEGIAVEGSFEGEVFANYSSLSDALRRFFTYGFSAKEVHAFSVPLRMHIDEKRDLLIGARTGLVEKSGGYPAPKVELRDKVVVLSHLRLGSEGAPRVPRSLLRTVMPELDGHVVDELFDRIYVANIAIMCELLELCETETTEAVQALRKAVLLQLRGMTHSFGVRHDVLEKRTIAEPVGASASKP